jgi:hypothetical protein
MTGSIHGETGALGAFVSGHLALPPRTAETTTDMGTIRPIDRKETLIAPDSPGRAL